MSRLRFCIATFLVICCAALVGGQPPKDAPQKFDLKLEKDKKFYEVINTDVTQVIKVMGQDLTQSQKSTFYFKWTPVKQEGEKWVLEDELEGVKMNIDISGNVISYDSTVPDGGATAGNPSLMEFFKKLIGAKFTVTMDKGKVEKVEGKDKFTSDLGGNNAQLDKLLKDILTEDALKQMCDPTFGLMPDAPKKPGETWKKDTTINLGPIGSYTVTYNFKYIGPEKDDKDKIEVDTTLVYNAPKTAPEGLLFRIKEGKLTSEAPNKGTIFYNTKTQRIESADITIKLKGELTVMIGMTETKVELTQTQTTSMKTSNESLLPGAAKTPPTTPASPVPPKK